MILLTYDIVGDPMRLNSQVSEYDCATTSLLNSLIILFQRDEIPVEILRIIYHFTLDCKYKIIGDCGTSKKAMKKICKKINRYSKRHNLELNFKYMSKQECTYSKIENCINKQGVAIIRSLLELEHYYIVTRIIKNQIYIWDPYINDEISSTCNYVIDKQIFDNEEKINYSLGPINNREVILVTKELLKSK